MGPLFGVHPLCALTDTPFWEGNAVCGTGNVARPPSIFLAGEDCDTTPIVVHCNGQQGWVMHIRVALAHNCGIISAHIRNRHGFT